MTTIAEVLQAGLRHHQAGQLLQAEQLYQQVLQVAPNNADAWHLLGVIAHSRGERSRALELIGKALSLDASQASYHFNLGEVHRALGQLVEARDCYDRTLRLNPDHASAHNNRGTVLQAHGLFAEAESSFREAIRLRPDYALAWNNLGAVLRSRGELAEARSCLERALHLQRDYVEAHNNLGTVWHASGDLERARACFLEALRLKPDHATAHHNLALIYSASGQQNEALTCFQQALRFRPDFAAGYLGLAGIFKDRLQFAEAQIALEQALRLQPNYVEALELQAVVFQLQGKLPEARARLEAAQAIQPRDDRAIRLALLLPIIYSSLEELQQHRRKLEEDLVRLESTSLRLTDPVHSVGGPPFFLAYHGLNDLEVQARLARIQTRACPELEFIAPHCRQRTQGTSNSQRLRVGFISNHFYVHTIGKLNLGLLRNLSRTDFHVTLFRFPGPDDSLARDFQQSADEVVTLPRKLEPAREQLAQRQLDILFYPDIGMDALTYYLAFARLAPVQCVSWGHPSTTGIPTVDYFLSSTHLETPDSDTHYTEKLVRMERLNSYYYEPQLSGEPRTRKDFGLAEDAHLYICPQTLYKIHPEFDTILGAILSGDPQGQIVFIAGMDANWDRQLAERFRRTIPDFERIRFIPRMSGSDFLYLQTVADVLLDPIHFGGGNTSYEALAFGTPIVTLPGAFLRSRITYACYRQMGIEDCIAENEEDYVRRALRLGMDGEWREEVRKKILASKQALYEDVKVVRELEKFFQEAAARARAFESGETR